MSKAEARKSTPAPLLSLGFRPFFLVAALFAAAGVPLWIGFYAWAWPLPLTIPGLFWHAHEMIYGYTMAVIAGFLLTAVSNWTGRQTVRGLPLLLLVGLWLAARLMPFVPVSESLLLMALFDLAFNIGLAVAVVVPIVRAGAWRQLGIVAKLVLLVLGNALFYAGLSGIFESGARTGIYFGLYLVIALILTMGRRIIPAFTESGVGYPVKLRNWRWLDVSSMVLFLLFMVADVVFQARGVAATIALILFALYGLRMWGWHTRGLWLKPLLWGLYVGYGFIVAGFALYAAAYFLGISPFLAVHAFAFGGIGVVTLSMIARVSLGHTGRNVHSPPRAVGFMLLALVAGALARTLLPLLWPAHYILWVGISGLLWTAAFIGFLVVYVPFLVRPRIDER